MRTHEYCTMDVFTWKCTGNKLPFRKCVVFPSEVLVSNVKVLLICVVKLHHQALKEPV